MGSWEERLLAPFFGYLLPLFPEDNRFPPTEIDVTFSLKTVRGIGPLSLRNYPQPVTHTLHQHVRSPPVPEPRLASPVPLCIEHPQGHDDANMNLRSLLGATVRQPAPHLPDQGFECLP